MASLYTAEFWGRLLEIGFLNLLLSGDNAVVIALAVRTLPSRERLLGQLWGTVGAVVLRLLFVGIVSLLLRIPFLRLVGGLLLVWIAIKLVQPAEEEEGGTRHGSSFWEAVWIIIVADVTMSLDNVLAIAGAARGDMLLVGVGVASSLPFVVWGSGVLANLMNRRASESKTERSEVHAPSHPLLNRSPRTTAFASLGLIVGAAALVLGLGLSRQPSDPPLDLSARARLHLRLRDASGRIVSKMSNTVACGSS